MLAEPGVLAQGTAHFVDDVRTLVAAQSRMLRRLAGLELSLRSLSFGENARHITDLAAAVNQLSGPL